LSRVSVLVVDDSAFARKVLRELRAAAPDIEVVGYARNGFDALEQISLLHPDVVTLDLMMPELDGLGVLSALQRQEAPPRVLLVSSSAADSDLALEALELGAIDIVRKPTALATDQLYDLDDELLLKVRVAASTLRKARVPLETRTPSGVPEDKVSVVAVGASTGGPQALARLLGALPADLGVPLVAVVHIPEGFTASLAERLDKISALRVCEAQEGLELTPGLAIIARAGLHLRLQPGDGGVRCHLDPLPPAVHCPSVDVLFESAALSYGSGVLGVVLTGMGDDGLRGAAAVHAAGGFLVTEHPSSSVVDGMPRAVREAGLSQAELALEHMASGLLALIRGRRS
jgi:two-component system, chemotaxis family, protein-glutamate methylesterase/glutaminase